MKNFALIGNPNCGKTTLFNTLTGSSAHVGNWPGVTVDKKIGVYKNGKREINIIDLPGIYSLSPYTQEEIITRNYIIDEKPDCVIDIVDVTNLERNLYLTTQLLEMDVPIIVALNMMDVLNKNGDSIDVDKLEKELGVPVVAISALKEKNLHILIDKAIKESEKSREAISVLFDSELAHLIKDLQIAFHTLDVSNPLFHAIKLAELDELEINNHPQFKHMVNDFKEENASNIVGEDYEAIIADERYKYITKHFSTCLKRKIKNNEDKKQDKIDKIFTHKIWGIPIFVFILFLIFHFVFSSNFLFLGSLFNFDAECFSFIDSGSIFAGYRGLFYSQGGLNSPGVMLSNLINGTTYMCKESIRNLLATSPSWVSGLICDGILGGIFAVFSFLPQILLLFVFFSLLEDSGYMARIAFILDRVLKKFGLSGRAFLPMIMGFGCSVSAMMNARTASTEKEKKSIIRVIPFFFCSAKLPLLTAIMGCIITSSNISIIYSDILVLFIYLFGILVSFISLFFIKELDNKNSDSHFIMELPSYHLPKFKSTMLLVWDKAKHFIKKAFTVILTCTILIWFVSHFNFSWQYVDNNIDQSILASLGHFLQPIFIPLGFGQINEGWTFVVASFTGLIAKENVVATLATLSYSVTFFGGISSLCSLFTSPMLLSFIIFNLFTLPCSASLATCRSEMSKKDYLLTLLFWFALSYFLSSGAYLCFTWWWVSFIYLFIIIGSFFVIKKAGKYLRRKNV